MFEEKNIEMLNFQLILWFLHDNHTAYREPELGDLIVGMESLAADCSDSNNNNNNNSEERITTTKSHHQFGIHFTTSH